MGEEKKYREEHHEINRTVWNMNGRLDENSLSTQISEFDNCNVVM